MEKINAAIIIEMMGKPPEYVKEMLSNYASKLEKEKGVRIISKKINEPKKVENSELFCSFADIELEFDDLNILMMVIFGYMPSHVEIIKPENLKINNCDLNTVFNELVRRLHEYDGIAKISQIQLQQLADKINILEGNIKPASKKTKKKSRAR